MRIVLLSVLLLLSCSPVNAQTQSEMNGDAATHYAAADKKLNDTYQKIRTTYKDNKLFLSKLQSSEQAWIRFRDAEMDALFPAADKQSQYGSVYPMCRNQWLAELTTQRAKELSRWVKGTKEGDCCAGSLKVNP
jgi:uncharacterized protein YecT (DUF1311 family)